MHEATERRHADAVRHGRRHDRGVLIPALVISALVHAFVFFGLSFEIPVDPHVPAEPIAPLVQVVPAMQALELVQVAGNVAPIDVQIREREELRPLPVRNASPGVVSTESKGERAAAEPIDPTPVRDRLRYRLNTPQVWRPPTEEVALEPTPQEIVEQRIAAQLGEYNDSVAAEAAAAARAMDWTVKDAEGGRWGVSPGAIHLGGLTIPIGDTHFAVAAGRREEFAGRVRTWNELHDQAVRVEARESFKDRVKAIEERKARERAEREGTAAPVAGTSGNTPPPAGKPTGGNNASDSTTDN